MRKYLIENTGDLLILNSKDKIFAEAAIDVCIISADKSVTNKITLAEWNKGDVVIVSETNSEEMSKFEVINISSFKSAGNLLTTIENNSKPLEENFATVKDDLKAYESGKGNPVQPVDKDEFLAFKKSKTYFSDERNDETYREFLNGSDLRRYGLNWSGKFIKYGKNLAAPRNPEIFEGTRILIGRIPVKAKYVFRATLTDDEFVHEQNIETIHNIKVNPCS